MKSSASRDDPADLPTSARHIPPALARITDRCLEKSPAARFQTASDLAFALSAISSSESVMHDTRPDSRREAPKSRRSAERRAWTGLVLGLAIAVALQLRSAGKNAVLPPNSCGSIFPCPSIRRSPPARALQSYRQTANTCRLALLSRLPCGFAPLIRLTKPRE